MPIIMCQCKICGAMFVCTNNDPTANDCGNAKRHAELNKPKGKKK